MKSWWKLTERFLITYSLYVYGRRFINILVVGVIVSLALTGIAAALIYGKGWNVHIPINNTWTYADPIKRLITEPSLIIGNSYLDSYNIYYHYPGYFFFTHYWSYSRYLSFYPGLVFIIISIPAGSLISAAVMRIIGQHMAKQRVGIGITGPPSLGRLCRFLLVNSIYWFLPVVLISTGVGIPVAIYIGFRWIFAGHAILFEGASIKDSLRRSAALFNNDWVRSITYVFVLSVIITAISAVMPLIPYWGSTAGRLLAVSIPPMFITIYYIALRIEKEAFTSEQIAIDLNGWAKGITPVYPDKVASDAENEQRQEHWGNFWEKRKIPQKTR